MGGTDEPPVRGEVLALRAERRSDQASSAGILLFYEYSLK